MMKTLAAKCHPAFPIGLVTIPGHDIVPPHVNRPDRGMFPKNISQMQNKAGDISVRFTFVNRIPV